jgi:hypothetical protein
MNMDYGSGIWIIGYEYGLWVRDKDYRLSIWILGQGYGL